MGISLLLAHWLIIVSYALFLHTHVLNDGTRIVHAHPFVQENQQNQHNSSPDQEQKKGTDHEHTLFSYLILSGLSNLFSEENSEFSFLTSHPQRSFVHSTLFIPYQFIFDTPQRGPPYFYFQLI